MQAVLHACSAWGPAPGFNVPHGHTKYAAFSVIEPPSTLVPTLGPVEKHPASPLFTGTEPWESEINNGYSSILYDPKDTFGLGRYRVYYSALDKAFHGSIPGESSGSATLYATSDDGLVFDKPALHRYNYSGSTTNNILFDGTTAVAVYDDVFHDKNASSRFKVWGNLPGLDSNHVEIEGYDHPAYRAQLGGSAVSHNGLDFTDYRRLQNVSESSEVPDTFRFDAQASLYFDVNTDQYVGTMRAFRPCATCGQCPIWWDPTNGCQSHVGPGCTPEQCNQTVRAIATSSSSSSNFQTTAWGPSEEVQAIHDDPTIQFYSQVSWPFYNIHLGIVMTFSAVDPHDVYGLGKVHCELAWSTDGTQYERLQPGADFIPLGDVAHREWDSHICFASAHPVKLHHETRIYYMGGDGPHYSPPRPSSDHRNSSFGLATLRPDGFVALRPRAGDSFGVAKTIPLRVSGLQLVVTADTAPHGRLVVEVLHPLLEGGAARCSPLMGRNVTDEGLRGCELLKVLGQDVVLKIRVRDAALYTFGFDNNFEEVVA